MPIVFQVFSVRPVLVSHICLLIAISTSATSNGQKPLPTPLPQQPDEVISAEKQEPSDDGRPLTSFEEEMRAKLSIKRAEKEYEDNISRAREISTVGRELQDSMQRRTSFDHDDVKRLDRLEKLTKKIRGEAGGADNEGTLERKPTDLGATVSEICETTEILSKHVQSTPRQVVSATVINTANVLLELIRFARTFSH